MNNREIATEMVKKMRLKGFSQKTVKAYMGHIRRLAQYYKTCVAALSSAQIEEYLLQQLNDGGRAASYINQCTAAFKFLYRDVLDSKEVVVNLPRMKKERILPDILTKEEVFRIISGVKNPKHRAMLVVTYSAGLRVGETVRLTIKDIDSQRMLIHVGQGKGRKDRYSVLSKKALKVLRDYARLYRPKGWLFEGQNPGQHITKRSLQRVFEEACKHSGITKDVQSMVFGMLSVLIYWKTGQILDSYKRLSVIHPRKPLNCTCMSVPGTSAVFRVLSTGCSMKTLGTKIDTGNLSKIMVE